MDPTKTRIWNADQLGLPAHKATAAPAAHRHAQGEPAPRAISLQGSSIPEPVTARTAAPVRARRAGSVPPPPPPPRRARASGPPLAPSTLTARWSANANAPGPMASTRILPIELLLPMLTQPSAARGAGSAQRRFGWLKRIGGHVLLATLTVLAVALWKLPLRQHVRARSVPASAAAEPPALGARASQEQLSSAAPDGPSPARALDVVQRQAPQPEAAHGADADLTALHDGARAALARSGEPEVGAEPGSRGSRRRGTRAAAHARTVSLQRQAVELVIGGDFAGAEQAYGLLAREHSDELAYREAARILAARHGK